MMPQNPCRFNGRRAVVTTLARKARISSVKVHPAVDDQHLPRDAVGATERHDVVHQSGASFIVETCAAITFQPMSTKRTQVWL